MSDEKLGEDCTRIDNYICRSYRRPLPDQELITTANCEAMRHTSHLPDVITTTVNQPVNLRNERVFLLVTSPESRYWNHVADEGRVHNDL